MFAVHEVVMRYGNDKINSSTWDCPIAPLWQMLKGVTSPRQQQTTSVLEIPSASIVVSNSDTISKR